jgi:catechol 2,3-dioxygenase-like lactoylglutathione lyase family enzyme
MEFDALDHVGLLVSDIDRSIEWYERVLGLERAYHDVSGRNPAVLVAKGTGVALFPGEGGPDVAAMFRPPAHVCFRLSARAYQSARAELERADIKYSESDHRVSRSLYVHDPDLHLVEITTYEIPPEKTSIGKKPE